MRGTSMWRKSCRRYRNYIFIVVSMMLIAMQVYLYMSTPGEGLEEKAADEFSYSLSTKNPWDKLAAKNLASTTNVRFGRHQNRLRYAMTKPFSSLFNATETLKSIPVIGLNDRMNNSYAHKNTSDFLDCGEFGGDVHSALTRAQSVQCKHDIARVACLHKQRNLYPPKLPRFCPLGGTEYGQYLGCYQNEKKDKIISDLMSEFGNTNTPMLCVNHCLRSGFEYAGVQMGFQCWCGVILSENAILLDDQSCNISCPGNKDKTCGAHLTMNIYRTGFGVKPSDMAGYVKPDAGNIQFAARVHIVFVLTVNGRAVRQVNRLLKALYRPHHYYYIHVDARQDYLYRELSTTTSSLPNVHMSSARYSTIWGGASLLTMLLKCMEDLMGLTEWQWDYFLNLSESDYPVKTVEELEAFLTKHAGKNFVKSHGKDTPRFIRKQGLNMLFHECDNHMWRLGERNLQDGIRMDGGSDWICLNRDFIQYLTYGNDELLTGLKSFWKYSLLPVESFFHTLLQNSMYCTTVINNNLHLTNWKRKQGCKCQYKHIVDWCGCSPNDFNQEDLHKIKSLAGKPIYFARKFEAIVNQDIINDLDILLQGEENSLDIPSTRSFWLNEYHHMDKSPADDVSYTFYNSFARITVAQLKHTKSSCDLRLGAILEGTVYKHAEKIQGLVITFEVVNSQNDTSQVIEAYLKPVTLYRSFISSDPVSRLKSVRIGTNYDPKEELFRNYGNMFGPHSDLVIEFRWGPGKPVVVTAVFIDPCNSLAVSYDVSVAVGGLVHTYRPELNKPLRPGIWTLKILYAWQTVVEVQFLVVPYSHLKSLPVGPELALRLHSGPGGPYVDQDFDDLQKFLQLGNSKLLKSEAEENARKHGDELLAWIDLLVQKTWFISDTCTFKPGNQTFRSSCLPVSLCDATRWSTKFPDPKSDLSELKLKSGILR